MSSSQQETNLVRLKAVLLNQNSILLAVLIALAIVFTFAEPKFFSTATASNILTDWGSVVLLAAGQTLVIISGGIDLSVGGILAISGVTSAWVMANVLGLDITTTGSAAHPALLVGAIVSVTTGLIVGLVNAFLITKLKIVPFVATLSTMGATLGFAIILSDGMPIGGPNDWALISPINPDWMPLSWAVIGVLIIVTIVGLFLHKSRFGLHVYAIGSNVFAARAAGINVERHLTKIYALSGALAGLAGFYVYLRLGAGSPSSGVMRELDAIAAVVIGGASLMGGVGRMIGTALGALILFTVQSGLIMAGVAPDWKKVVVAVLIAAAVAVQAIRPENRRR